VNDLLDISKVESGKMPLQRKPVNIVESFKRTTGIFQVLADEKKIDFSIESPDELWASVDDDKIERILMNLLSNAFKFVPSGCKICSRLKCENDLLIFEVEDNGPGIDPALREKVFDRFYQADAGDSKNFGGTGLGLSIVKDFAQLHGGTATILGSNRGGVLARIEIPWLRGDANLSEAAGVPELHETKRAAIKELQVANEDNPSTAQNVNADVLVIEDHLEMRDFLKQSLESECSVFAAANAAQALVYLKSHAPKLIVTDLMMPGMSGADFFKELLKDSELKSIPVMFLTAKADEHIRLEMISLGAFDYLLKPFSVDELRLKVRNALILIRSKQTLQSELKMRGADLSKLALEIVQQKHELELALKTAVLAREDAIESSKAKAGFLNMVSHELRTPLSVITMTAEFLSHESDRLGEDRRRQLTQTLLRSSQSLKALVETLLEYSRIKKGKFVSKMNAFDVLELVTLVTNEHRPLAEAKGLQLSVTVTQNETISTDRDLLRLVLSNLVSNAIKYTNSGAISLTATREENDIRIAVEDTGIGIESKYLDKIFDEFERVPGPSSFVPGMGLGLSLVKSLLAAVNGNISVNSTLGKGSRFDVLLRNVCQDLKQTKIQQGLGGKK
jgi:signal transduction histidine kinase